MPQRLAGRPERSEQGRRPRPRRARRARAPRAPARRTRIRTAATERLTPVSSAPPMRTPSLSQRGAETRGDAIAATAPSRSTRGPSIPNAPPVLSRRFGHCGVTDPEGTTRAEGNNDNCWVGWREARGSFEKVTPFVQLAPGLSGSARASRRRGSRDDPGDTTSSVGAPSSCSLTPTVVPVPLAPALARPPAPVDVVDRARSDRINAARALCPATSRDASLADVDVGRRERRARRGRARLGSRE